MLSRLVRPVKRFDFQRVQFDKRISADVRDLAVGRTLAIPVAGKPMFPGAHRHRHCIIPASDSFEWTGGKGGQQLHLFAAEDGSPIRAFAGLREHWRDPEAGRRSLLPAI